MQSNSLPVAGAPARGLQQPLLNIHDLARRFGLSKKTVYRLVEGRHVPFYRLRGVLRFDAGDIEAYLASHKTASVTTQEYGRS